MSHILNLTSENFQQLLTEGSQDKLFIIEFYSPQSPECIQQAPVLENIASQYEEQLLIGKLDCDLEQALASQLAQQLNIQAIPTLVIIKNGAPVDMLPGPQSESQLIEALSKHLPSQEDMMLEKAKQALLAGEMEQAYSYAKKAMAISPDNIRVKLVFADICLNIKKLDDAKALLDAVPLEEQDAYYTNLQTKLKSALEAQDSPEIKQLQQQVKNEPDNLELKIDLAMQYDQVGRKEEALIYLFSVLQKDLAFANARKSFLDVIATLPEGDSLASKYRRKLYSILY